MGLTLGGKLLDVRVSTLPSRAGERVVLRILDKENAGIDLPALGLDPAMFTLLTGALTEPNGIILVTGPTGSGKTTTLYAALRLLKRWQPEYPNGRGPGRICGRRGGADSGQREGRADVRCGVACDPAAGP